VKAHLQINHKANCAWSY